MSWNVKDATRNVPQPWRCYIARVLLVPVVIVTLPVAIVVEGSKWVANLAGEIVDAWKDTRTW